MENQQTQPVQPQPMPGYGLAIASMILGILAVLTGIFYFGGALGILAIIFGIIALKKKAGLGMAIAGIITGGLGLLGSILVTVLVLFAVPALQSSTRDTERKNQVSLAASDIVQAQAENNGTLPDPAKFSEQYETRSLTFVASGEPTSDTAVYVVGKNCEGQMSSRAFSVSVKLENGEIYCQGS